MKVPVFPHKNIIRLIAYLIIIVVLSTYFFFRADFMVVSWCVYGIGVLSVGYRMIYAYRQKCKSYFLFSFAEIIVFTLAIITVQLIYTYGV